MKHSKITSIFLALFILLTLMATPASASATAVPGFVDGSFEEWGTTGVLEGWLLRGAAGITATDDVKADGNYSAKIQATGEQARVAFYQNLGKLPLGTSYTVSVKVNAKSFSGSGARLMVRFGSDGGSPYWGPSEKVDAATNGWKELTVTGTVNETSAELDAFVVLDIMAESADYEIYMDACKVEKMVATVTNGDFEKGGEGWTISTAGASADANIITENGNSYVKFTASGQRMQTTVTNLTPGATYRLCFDVRSYDGHTDQKSGIMYLDFGDSSRLIIAGITTDDKWQHHSYMWKNGETTTKESFRFMFNGTATVENPYIMYDNIAIEEVENEDGNLMSKWTYNTFASATVSSTEDAFEGGHAIRVINNGNGDEVTNATDDVQIKYMSSIPASTYEFSVYVKNVSLSGEGSILLRPSDQVYQIETSTLPKNEWVRISTISTGNAPQIYIRDIGEVLLDKISFKELNAPVVSFAKANGAHAEAMANGVKATVEMPVTEAGMAVLAVYKRRDKTISVADIRVQALGAEDVTKGYKKFALSASSLGDFESANYYAKLMILKNGTLSPVINEILLTK